LGVVSVPRGLGRFLQSDADLAEEAASYAVRDYDSVIAANSLVIADVPTKATVLGVPAVTINEKGSDDYIK
jgi:hypothetical protein